MKEKICPLLFATTPKAAGSEMSRCRLDECAWFYQSKEDVDEELHLNVPEKMGFCSITRIAGGIAMISKGMKPPIEK